MGARPIANLNALRFGNPEHPRMRHLIAGVVHGIGGVGLLDDWEKSANIAFKAAGEDIVLIFDRKTGHLGQSLWLREIHGRKEGPPPPVDLKAECGVATFICDSIADGTVTAVHDISDGGFLVAVAEMALAGDIGASIDLGERSNSTGWAFGEDQSSYVATVPDGLAFVRALSDPRVSAIVMGTTGGTSIDVSLMGNVESSVTLADLRAAHEGFFPKLMGADAALA